MIIESADKTINKQGKSVMLDFCRKLPPCDNFQHSIIIVKIPFISQYSKICTSPDVFLKNLVSNCTDNDFITRSNFKDQMSVLKLYIVNKLTES